MGRIGLCLGAGGIVGHAYHAGVLCALAEATDWDPRHSEIVVGTSAGSAYGALIRAGLSASDLAARALGRPLSPEGRSTLGPVPPMMGPPALPRREPREWLRPASLGILARSALQPWRARPGLLAAGLLPEGLIPTDDFAGVYRPLFGDAWPQRTFWACAVRLHDGQRVVWGREGSPATDVASAVMSSCAIPGFFAPAEIDGVRYVDGGAHSVTNLDLLADEGLDLVIASAPMSVARGTRIPGIVSQYRNLQAFTLGREAARVRRSGTPVVAFQPTADDLRIMGVNAMDVRRRAAVVQQARESTLRRLERADMRERLAALSA